MSQMCGGTGPAHDANGEIQALIDEIRGDLETKVGKSYPQYKAVSYRSQVVAGTNFFVKIQVGDNEYIHVRIFRPLPHTGGDPELHSHQLGKTKDDELAYF